ncbi:MAG TPA: hypothetical protein VI306_17825 [Pyrinomonadaceae bacterium]
MNYETPEVLELGQAEEIVLGSVKPAFLDGNGTGIQPEAIDEDVE